jgi:hypothetical protein
VQLRLNQTSFWGNRTNLGLTVIIFYINIDLFVPQVGFSQIYFHPCLVQKK